VYVEVNDVVAFAENDDTYTPGDRHVTLVLRGGTPIYTFAPAHLLVGNDKTHALLALEQWSVEREDGKVAAHGHA